MQKLEPTSKHVQNKNQTRFWVAGKKRDQRPSVKNTSFSFALAIMSRARFAWICASKQCESAAARQLNYGACRCLQMSRQLPRPES